MKTCDYIFRLFACKAEEDVTPVIFEEPLTCCEPVAVAEAKEPIAAAKAPRPTTSDGREIRTPESSSILFSPDPAGLSEASTRCATADKVQVRTVELPKARAPPLCMPLQPSLNDASSQQMPTWVKWQQPMCGPASGLRSH
ncbi:unnamed protein product, partial [Symbiodinium sp. KB8]